MPDISNARVLVLATHGFEQSELEYPVKHLREKGAEVCVASPDGQDICGWSDGDWGERVAVDAKIGDLQEGDFDALVLPGGQMNPDILRTKPEAVRMVKAFYDAGKPIAAICHGPWLLVEADVLRGRSATSYASIATDVKNAGADWKDEEVVVDQAIITSRSPKDLPAFVAKIVEEIEEGAHNRSAA
ncbi:type 1 glutamine amidotransferase domain-containing protein [Frigidibacter sp. SD6-1]|uniref:type 1 glutamine amidotransferase domain-containing protein n=1 Tax=Frigidibacter sp. SD6-1 TaxID=3032581 RepID=UPI0024DFE9B4|nr:type 1 glutamine amidotransferase domain-containing protein [Frigidibacter sp. SD6-1]